MDESPILVDEAADYRVITLNRPQRLNSFTEDMHRALKTALDEAEADPTCRALMITGAGRGFCAGQDLNDRLAKPGEKIVLGGDAGAILQSADPQVARPALPCYRRGEWCCRRRRRQYRARLRHRGGGEVRHVPAGLRQDRLLCRIPAAHGFCRASSVRRARGLALLAEPLTAEKAAKLGPDLEMRVAMTSCSAKPINLCERLASRPDLRPVADQARARRRPRPNDLSTQLDLERDLQRAAGSSPDYAEGVKAFVEKRAPNFTGEERLVSDGCRRNGAAPVPSRCGRRIPRARASACS